MKFGPFSRQSNGLLYEVETDDAAVLHRGDMRLVDRIGAVLRDDPGSDLSAIVDSCWAGAETADPIIEILLPSAAGKKMIGTNEQRIEVQGSMIIDPEIADANAEARSGSFRPAAN